MCGAIASLTAVMHVRVGGYEETTCTLLTHLFVWRMHAWVLDYRAIPTVTAALFVW